MNVAILSHDTKKELLMQFCIAYKGALSRHNICATGNTAKIITDATGIKVQRFLSGNQGGAQQISARVACNEIDLVLYFRDTTGMRGHDAQDLGLLRLCDVHNIPLATNIATAEVLIHGLDRGDLEWRNIINSN